MEEIARRGSLTKYVFLGAFIGSVVGTIIVLYNFSDSEEEKKQGIKELQRELLKPISMKLSEVIDNIGEAFKKALEDTSHKKTAV
jgi:hypothetical protein